MKRLVVLLLSLTPWVMHSMEPKEVKTKEALVETLAKLLEQRRGRWVTSVEEVLPADIPTKTATKISQVIAQEVLRKGPPIRQFILDKVSLPFKNCGHTLTVCSAVFNPTGDKVVTASNDNTARIWDTETGTLLNILKGHTNRVQSAAFSPTGDKVVTGSFDTTARIWDTETGKLLHTLEGHTTIVRSAVFNPTGDKVVTASENGTARIWDTETSNLLRILEGHTTIVRSAVFNPTGNKVVTASGDGTARIWDTETGNLLHTLEGHTARVNSVAFNPTGDKVVTASNDTTARIWDTETGNLIHTLIGHTGTVWSAVFNSAGDKIVTASHDRTARVWDLEPFLSCAKFFAKDITHRQVAILNDIFHVRETQYYLKILIKIAFERVALLEGLESITFDFNKYPHLWNDYASLPEAIRHVCDPYITKPSLENDLKRLNCAQEQPSKRQKIESTLV